MDRLDFLITIMIMKRDKKNKKKGHNLEIYLNPSRKIYWDCIFLKLNKLFNK